MEQLHRFHGNHHVYSVMLFTSDTKPPVIGIAYSACGARLAQEDLRAISGVQNVANIGMELASEDAVKDALRGLGDVLLDKKMINATELGEMLQAFEATVSPAQAKPARAGNARGKK